MGGLPPPPQWVQGAEEPMRSWLLAKFAEKAQSMLQKQGHLLLEKK